MKVVGGSSSESLSGRVESEVGCELVGCEFEEFPDGELYVRVLGNVSGEEVLVVQSTCESPNKNLMELFLLLDTVRDLGANQISAIVPYLAYARQDKRFESGEALSRSTVSNLIVSSGADEVFCFDVHGVGIGEDLGFFSVPARNLTCVRALVDYFVREYDLVNPIVMGPDEGAKERARIGGESIGADWDFMIKERKGPEEVEISPRELSVNDRDVIIVDDIISTGGTMSNAIEILKNHGAGRVFAGCSHPVLADNAVSKMRNAGVSEIVGTDTIENEFSKVSVAPIISNEFSE